MLLITQKDYGYFPFLSGSDFVYVHETNKKEKSKKKSKWMQNNAQNA